MPGYYRETPGDNGYARPVEGVIGFVDMARGEVLEVLDIGVVPLPPETGSYYPDDNGPRRTDLKPLEIVQPEGPSFTVEGNLLRGSGGRSGCPWTRRGPGPPHHRLRGRRPVRSILYRAAISEMVVPYGDPGPMHGWKNAFDAGEWGLGRMANSLTLGCDCLGEIHYLDAVFASEHGTPVLVANAICLHEEDYGILWKHRTAHRARPRSAGRGGWW